MEANETAQHSAAPTYSSHERSGHHSHGLLDKLGDAAHKAAVAIHLEDPDSRDSAHSLAAQKRLDHQRAEELADEEQRSNNAQATLAAHPAARSSHLEGSELASETVDAAGPGPLHAASKTYARPANEDTAPLVGTAGDDRAI